MTNDVLVDQLIELVDFPQTARSRVAELNDETLAYVAAKLSERARLQLQRDATRALAITQLIFDIAEWRDSARIRALALQAKGIVLTLSQREFETALSLFAESEEIYQTYGDELEIASGRVTRVWAMACLQQFDEAFTAGEWAAEVLIRHESYQLLAALNNNLAAIYGRRGQDREALERLQQVEAAYQLLGEEGLRRRPFALINQAIVLRNMGRFSESIAANDAALELAQELGQTTMVARAEQNLGITYFLRGHINRAQLLLQKARDTFILDQRYRDAILADLFVSDGLLYLRRYEDVLEICRRVKETFQEAGTQFEVAQALLNEATAFTGIHAYEKALLALEDAREIFTEEGNQAWQVYTDLEKASILYRLQHFEASERLAYASAGKLRTLHLPLREAEALIITAEAALARERWAEARDAIEQAGEIARTIDAPAVTYKAFYLLGRLALAENDNASALSAYDAAIHELERLQGRIMVEFRADFLADKDEVYAHAVDLCLQAGNTKRALSYAEKAKSRALLSMLSHHVDLRIEAKRPGDQKLVDQILSLRERRDRLYRRWETGETPGSTVNREEEQEGGLAARQEARNDILRTEDEIRTLWHQLLVSNTAYIHDASLWQVQTQLDQESLDEKTLVVEYFTLPHGLVVFLISASAIQAIRLAVGLEDVDLLQHKLTHNFNIVNRAPHLASKMTAKAQGTLHEIYQALIAPWIERANGFERLVIVPHGPLHYLPFHAFYDGHEYLLQHFQISYLPGSSFIGKRRPTEAGLLTPNLVMGHTQHGLLTHVPEEANAVAQVLNTKPYLNGESTRHRFQNEAPDCQIIHIAAHGDFIGANPLFSGLHLEDGLLTTLDIFNMRLGASLVTLSACETGRSIVRGGDELFGLTRAFLTAGAASLILTLWPVEDHSTTTLMRNLYHNLLAGSDKIASLQNAQLRLMSGSGNEQVVHPYFWAPFFLIGDPGAL